jgi:hypothetical protein
VTDPRSDLAEQVQEAAESALAAAWAFFVRSAEKGLAWEEVAGCHSPDDFRRKLAGEPGGLPECCRTLLDYDLGLTAEEREACRTLVALADALTLGAAVPPAQPMLAAAPGPTPGHEPESTPPAAAGGPQASAARRVGALVVAAAAVAAIILWRGTGPEAALHSTAPQPTSAAVVNPSAPAGLGQPKTPSPSSNAGPSPTTLPSPSPSPSPSVEPRPSAARRPEPTTSIAALPAPTSSPTARPEAKPAAVATPVPTATPTPPPAAPAPSPAPPS